MKHHEAKHRGKRKSSDGEDTDLNDGGYANSDQEGQKENVRPIGTKKARRLQEEQDFIERTTAALGKHLNCKNFGMSPHFQQTMADLWRP